MTTQLHYIKLYGKLSASICGNNNYWSNGNIGMAAIISSPALHSAALCPAYGQAICSQLSAFLSY